MNWTNKKLKYSLLANALFSSTCSMILLLATPFLADLFHIESSLPFHIVAILLLFFVAMLLYAVFKKPMPKTLITIIITLDWIWVLGSICIISFHLFSISTSGYIIIASIALVITILALLQAYYFNRLRKSPK